MEHGPHVAGPPNERLRGLGRQVAGWSGSLCGSLLAEIAGTVIPNQRIDRVVKFAAQLEAKLAALEQDFVRSQLTNENFTDLMEEGLRQAARSLSDERREHIDTLISHSLDPDGMSYADSRHFLRRAS